MFVDYKLKKIEDKSEINDKNNLWSTVRFIAALQYSTVLESWTVSTVLHTY